jgi:hypothetical protein
METGIIRELQDLTYLKWSHIRSSSGTAGTFLKSGSTLNNTKRYYKLSNFDPECGVVGHECVNEIVVDRLLSLLGIPHLHYELIHAKIEIEGRTFITYLCASEDFKARGESKIALDDYYRTNALPGESRYDFCVRNGWREYIEAMLAVDFLILNRDRHGANIEVLRNARARTLRIAPLFDHGLSLLCSCRTEEAASKFNVMEDKPCNNFIGTYSCRKNLALIEDPHRVFSHKLKAEDRGRIFEGLEGILPGIYYDKIWEMIFGRYQIYEDL